MTAQNHPAEQSLERRTVKHIAFTVLHLALGFLAICSALYAIIATFRLVVAALTGESVLLLNVGEVAPLVSDNWLTLLFALTLGAVAYGFWQAERYIRNRSDLYLAP